MLRCRRLFAEQPIWKQFFTGERQVDLDYFRCFKDQSDPVRLLLTLKVPIPQESSSSEFTDMPDRALLKGMTLINYLSFHAKRFTKDTIVVEKFWKAAKLRLEGGQMSWTPQNVSLMSEFLVKHQNFALEQLKQSTLSEVFQQAGSLELRLPYLANAVLGATVMPSFYSKLYNSLVAKFNETKGRK